jgi:photosystem II stability/assembly factor-like uncharacterized protein
MKSKKSAFMLIMLLTISAFSMDPFAGSNVWTPIGPEGGMVKDISFSPASPSMIGAATYGGGIFISTNGGSTWNAMNTGITNLKVNCLAWHPTNANTLYAGTDGGYVLKSTDTGGHWNAVTSTKTVNIIKIDPDAPDTIYAGTNGNGIYKSSDGGSHWSLANGGLGVENMWIMAIAIVPGNPGTIFAGTDGGGVIKSTDGGASWVSLNLASTAVRSLAVDNSNTNIIYVGTYGRGVPRMEEPNGPISLWACDSTSTTYTVLKSIRRTA